MQAYFQQAPCELPAVIVTTTEQENIEQPQGTDLRQGLRSCENDVLRSGQFRLFSAEDAGVQIPP